jgi:protein disulfide-isomerase-like protein
MVAIRSSHLVGVVLLASATSSALGEAVETLTSANFGKRIQADILLVKFYAPWCGHCKAMAPAYEEAAQKLARSSPPIPLAKVDATKEPDLSSAQGVRGYPTLKIYRRGAASDYGGPRDADGIVNFMKKEAGSAPPASPASAGAGSGAATGGPLIARLCRDQACHDASYPMLDYKDGDERCHCAAHPCWDDGGKAHHCDSDEMPNLAFSYTKDGVLQCSCKKEPQYMSKYIAQVKCPGEHCDSQDFPFLDYVREENKCVCRPHPCHDLDGQRHDCGDPAFPILLYREENQPGGGVKKICECKKRINKKEDLEL